jgi:hypothetical protein
MSSDNTHTDDSVSQSKLIRKKNLANISFTLQGWMQWRNCRNPLPPSRRVRHIWCYTIPDTSSAVGSHCKTVNMYSLERYIYIHKGCDGWQKLFWRSLNKENSHKCSEVTKKILRKARYMWLSHKLRCIIRLNVLCTNIVHRCACFSFKNDADWKAMIATNSENQNNIQQSVLNTVKQQTIKSVKCT